MVGVSLQAVPRGVWVGGEWGWGVPTGLKGLQPPAAECGAIEARLRCSRANSIPILTPNPSVHLPPSVVVQQVFAAANCCWVGPEVWRGILQGGGLLGLLGVLRVSAGLGSVAPMWRRVATPACITALSHSTPFPLAYTPHPDKRPGSGGYRMHTGHRADLSCRTCLWVWLLWQSQG